MSCAVLKVSPRTEKSSSPSNTHRKEEEEGWEVLQGCHLSDSEG